MNRQLSYFAITLLKLIQSRFYSSASCVLLFVLFCSSSLYSQAPEQRHFNENNIESLKGELSPIYQSNTVDNVSWNEKIWDWLGEKFMSFLGFLAENLNLNISPVVFKVIFYSFLIAALAYLILKIVGADGTFNIFRSKKKLDNTSYEIGDENVEQANFPALIEQATKDKNYTLIIRYYYLYALQVLSDKKAIDYHIRKTNTLYINELKDQKSAEPFIEMASLFEYIWYGNYSAKTDHCNTMAEKMKILKQSLN